MWAFRLPLNLYNIFVIETKYGFNKQSHKGFMRDYTVYLLIECVKFTLAVPLALFVISIAGD